MEEEFAPWPRSSRLRDSARKALSFGRPSQCFEKLACARAPGELAAMGDAGFAACQGCRDAGEDQSLGQWTAAMRQDAARAGEGICRYRGTPRACTDHDTSETAGPAR